MKRWLIVSWGDGKHAHVIERYVNRGHAVSRVRRLECIADEAEDGTEYMIVEDLDED